jgi:G patch domain and KOW motifs-containing protein
MSAIIRTFNGFSGGIKGTKKKKKLNINEEDVDEGDDERNVAQRTREAILSMNKDGVQLKDDNIMNDKNKNKEKNKIIPSMKDTFEVGTGRQRKIPSFVPTKQEQILDNKRFEISETIGGETAQNKATTVYGLTQMGPKDEEAKALYEFAKKEGDKNRESFIGKSLAEKELDAFKEDVEDLPEQASIEAYESMPIEEFGAAMLRGMGWTEGHGVGRNAKNSGRADPVEFVPRMGRLGLGADTVDIPSASLLNRNSKKILKPGESREEKKEVLVRDPNVSREPGMRNVKSIDEKLVKKEELGVKEGKRMYVSKGQHEGLCGRVLHIYKTDGKMDRAQIELDPSGEVVTVRCSELDEMSARKNANDTTTVLVGEKRKSSEDKSVVEKNGKKAREENDDDDDDDENEAPWLFPSIRVRIVSKSFSGGKYYLKKGTIVDIPTPKECTVQLDEDKGAAPALVSSVRQSALETCVPKQAGGRIVVLLGKLRGRRGKLVQKNKSSDTARIQLSDDFSVHDDIDLDSIAEYLGEENEDD